MAWAGGTAWAGSVDPSTARVSSTTWVDDDMVTEDPDASSEATPEPTPEPVPEPTPEPAPEPAPDEPEDKIKTNNARVK
jgi:hypothetical protein